MWRELREKTILLFYSRWPQAVSQVKLPEKPTAEITPRFTVGAEKPQTPERKDVACY